MSASGRGVEDVGLFNRQELAMQALKTMAGWGAFQVCGDAVKSFGQVSPILDLYLQVFTLPAVGDGEQAKGQTEGEKTRQ